MMSCWISVGRVRRVEALLDGILEMSKALDGSEQSDGASHTCHEV